MRRLIVALALLPTLASAEVPMTGTQFDAYTLGKTLTYGAAGDPYGVEQYLAGRRVVWAFLGDKCRTGSWYEAGEQICFVYDDDPNDPQCWRFFSGSGGLQAQFSNDPGSTALIEVEKSADPMACPGPDLGV